MRLAVLIAASTLVAGCSSTTGDGAGSSQPTVTTPSSSATSSAPRTSQRPPAPTMPPPAGAPVADVISWIEAVPPADVAPFHTATRDGEATNLQTDVAFTGPSGTPNCMTDVRFDGALACLVDLADPPPQPAEAYGQWKGNWVDFGGQSVEIGSVHGDPGRFSAGLGPELPPGRSLAFGDYKCRADRSAVVCVDYAHQTAVRFDGTGIQTYGCLKPVPPPADVGKQYRC